MRKNVIVAMLGMMACSSLSAQNASSSADILKAYSDSLRNLSASYHAYFRLWDDPNVPMPKLKPNPDFYKLFVPPTFYFGVTQQAYAIDWCPGELFPRNRAADSLYHARPDSIGLSEWPNGKKKKQVDRWVNRILLNYYLQYPDRVKGNELYLADAKPLDEEKKVSIPRNEQVMDYVEPKESVRNVKTEKELVVIRPNFWTKKGNGYAQFSQNYISGNWYKGGESTVSLLSGLTLEANYNDRQKVQWDNKFEAKLGFITAPSDTVHSYKTNTDLLRMSSKLGVQAWKYWYYTLAAEFKTQFFANYTTNTNLMISNFLSPAEFDVTLGMDYKRSGANYTLSLLTSPLAYTFMYISNRKIVKPEAFNVESGHKTANLFGSKFIGELNWQVTPTVNWISRLEYFTTYAKIIANWENTIDFKLTKYLSTKLFVNPRFDDGVVLSQGKHSYFQLQELFSLGLNYTW